MKRQRRSSNPRNTPRREESSSSHNLLMMNEAPLTTSPEEMMTSSTGFMGPPLLPLGSDGSDSTSIVHNIASFLTLSDAGSLMAMSSADLQQQQQQYHQMMSEAEPHQMSFVEQPDVTPADSWAVGLEYEGAFSSSWSISTPLTPALVALSPGATPSHLDDETSVMDHHYNNDEGDGDDDSSHMRRVLQMRTRRWAQERLTMAIFGHPGSLRSYCLDAYRAAQEIRAQQQQEMNRSLVSSSSGEEEEEAPETKIYPTKKRSSKSKRKSQADPRLQVLHRWIDIFVLENIPLSIVLDLLQATGDLSLDTTWASLTITDRTIHATMHALAEAIRTAWDSILHVLQNPRHYAGAIITMQFNAVERTSGAFATGLHSVASVGSASSRALIHRWSHANLSSVTAGSTAPGTKGAALNSLKAQKALLRKLSNINDAAEVVAYQEVCDETGGLTQKEIHRTRRMMHYSVSLRPFVATVAIPPAAAGRIEDIDESDMADVQSVAHSENGEDNEDSDDEASPFMCTPQSFPPTPHSRHRVLMSKQRKSNDIVFSARDKLRIHGALNSQDERTREMARLLKKTEALAAFIQPSQEDDIELSCGNHVATKRGSTVYYSTTRSMVPLCRNSYVYFEMYVLPHMMGGGPPLAMPTLSVGLSTQEMPPNTLVGAWQGSVGIYTTGQILLSGTYLYSISLLDV